MATPRKVSVAIQVGLGAGPVDVTKDIVSFSFEESIAGAGETLDLTVDNASGLFGDPIHFPRFSRRRLKRLARIGRCPV